MRVYAFSKAAAAEPCAVAHEVMALERDKQNKKYNSME